LNQRQFIGQAIDGRVFAVLKTVEDIGIGGKRKMAQYLRQVGRADFAGSTRAVRKGS